MNERVASMGAVKLFEHLVKHYRAVVVKGINRTRLLKRRFRTWTQAEDYGKRFVERWRKLHGG